MTRSADLRVSIELDMESVNLTPNGETFDVASLLACSVVTPV